MNRQDGVTNKDIMDAYSAISGGGPRPPKGSPVYQHLTQEGVRDAARNRIY